MDIQALLEDLRRRDVRLWADGGSLRLSAAKGSLTPELKQAIGERKAEILDFLTDQGQTTAGPPPITPASLAGPPSLSFGQERLWFLHQMEPSAAYNLQMDLHLQGALDRHALEKAFQEILRRHQVLRTTFSANDEEPAQIVHPTPTSALEIVDLSAVQGARRWGEGRRLREHRASHVFDLSDSPPSRFLLVIYGEDRHELVITQHHIVTDGWSQAILFQELLALYSAYLKDEPSPLPELPVQYGDFAAWQREWLRGDVLERELSHWRRRLDRLPVLHMPTDRPRPPLQTFDGAQQAVEIPAGLSAAIRELSRREGATLFAVLLSAFKVLLSRYSGQTDVVVGTSNGNRDRLEIEQLIGFFVNTQVLRTDLSGDPTFREIVRRVASVSLEAVEHQAVPFERLVQEFEEVRDLSRTPLFQVMFIIQNTPLEALEHGAAAGRLTNDLGIFRPAESEAEEGWRSLSVSGRTGKVRENRASKFDITLYLMDTEDGLKGTFEYNTSLFDHATIARMSGHYETILTAVVADPELRLSEVPVLTPVEQNQLVREWNATERDFPTETPVHALFERQAELTPHSPAVELADRRLTYGEVSAASDALARSLRQMGVGKGSLVGIFLERSPEMVVSLLGTLKAGAGYVPLDPMFPPDRLSFMLNDCQARVVLTQRAILDLVPESSAEVVCLEDLAERGASDSDEPAPPVAVGPTDLAYVIYTSGSTGQPKGVKISHGALTNFLLSMKQEPGIGRDDTLLAVTTLSFDIAGLELFLPLLVGGRTVLVTRDVAWDGVALASALRTSGATVMQATPATWRLLLEAGWEGSKSLRALCGGEALPRDLADALLARTGELWNMYGPTETTVWSTVQHVDTTDGPILIGRPIANTSVYILDAGSRPVPIGVPGELYIGGAGLALGYLDRPELSDAKFVKNPFDDDPTSRLYRTGDQARYREDGSIEYLGRLDSQVKVRGFRIELGEVEAALNDLPSVRAAVASVQEKSAGDRRLTAHVIANQDPPPPPAELRAELQERLPRYMVPSTFLFVPSFPLTPNGKVDRNALPFPDETDEPVRSYVAPRDEVERAVADIWREVLGREQVGVDDNFFDLGGHSLLLARVHRQIVRRLETDVTIIDLFQHPTVASLAERIGRAEAPASSLAWAHERATRRDAARARRANRRPPTL
jgi:amino acid adenylation domain-containing protein